MNNRIIIQDELQQVSPAMAAWEAKNPYTVPTGYFEGFASQMLMLVGEEKEFGVIISKNTPYSTPLGYFEALPNVILKRIQEQSDKPEDNIETSSITAGIQTPYKAPAGYFNALPGVILGRVKTEHITDATEELEAISPLLSGIGKKTPFSLPEGFFSELPVNVTEGAQAIDFVNEELENLSPLMQSLQPLQTYCTPAGYFEQFPEQALNAARNQQPAKVVKISSFKKVLQYAVAAAITVAVFTTGWLYTHRSGSSTGLPVSTVAVLDKQVKDSLHRFDDQDLQTFLEEQQTSIPENAALASNDIKPANVQDMLEDVSDEELQQYLDQYTASNSTNNSNTYTN